MGNKIKNESRRWTAFVLAALGLIAAVVIATVAGQGPVLP